MSKPDLTWVEVDLPEPPKQYGVTDGAELEVVVTTNHLERVVEYRCLCAACQEVEAVGLDDAVGGELPDGVHYLKSWHEVHRGFDYTEHDSGLALNMESDQHE